MTSYRDRQHFDVDIGSVVNVRQDRAAGLVVLELGEWRAVGAFSDDAWSALTPEHARELARDLFSAADQMEPRRR
jgi:hypothetical protein